VAHSENREGSGVRGLLGLALSAWAVTAAAECLLYERDVTLAGVVNHRAFAGSPESAAILHLESPICVRSRQQDDPGINVPYDNIRLIQLVLLPSIVGPLPDGKVAVTGTLSGAHAERYRTRVLLYVKTIKAYESR
jgi:hypothetical protein